MNALRRLASIGLAACALAATHAAAACPPQPPEASAGAPPAQHPLLVPLVGPIAWQAETRAVVKELVASMPPHMQSRVASVPIVFDPNANDVNAFAGCDDRGGPFVAATEGLLEAIDALSQTKATDELYGTRTYDAYLAAVAPRLAQSGGGSALLPLGTIPPAYWLDLRRASRARELFDEIVGFTFAHELAHHYLGHTACSGGRASGAPPAPTLGDLAVSIVPGLNQPLEVAADTSGTINLLDTGRARAASAYAWNEEGGLVLLDFFERVERASGVGPTNPVGFLRTHPHSALRVPVVQATAAAWRAQHPR